MAKRSRPTDDSSPASNNPPKKARTTKPPPTDILISIYPKHVANILAHLKNHEFRTYLLPSTVQRLWIYETAPISAIRYCAVIEPGKKPGEIAEDDLECLDNRKFNLGELPGKEGTNWYAYKIAEFYRLERTYTLEELKNEGWAKGAPQKYNFAPEEMVSQLKPGLVKEF